MVAGGTTAALSYAIWHFLLQRILVGESAAFRHSVELLVLGSGLLLVLCVTLAVIFTVRRLLGVRLRRLTEAMAAAEKGDFLIRARVDDPDELGLLGRSFNALLRKITAQEVAIIDTGRELTMTRRELQLKHELAEKARIIAEQNRQLETQVRELGLLFDSTKTITSQLELPKILDSLCQQVGKTLGFEEFAILLTDEATGQLVVRVTYGIPDGDAIRGLCFNPGEGISGIVARTGEWVLIPDTSKDARYLHYKGRHLADGSFLCVPLRYQDHLVGLFNVLRPQTHAFTDEDVRIMVSLANTAALAITNAKLFDRVAKLSLTDELTALCNRRHLQQRAKLELEGAQRYGEPVAFLTVDIDNFRQYNDAHGRRGGDEVLLGVARVLRASVRKVDTVARYDGEEFVVMLPRVAKREATAIAEKLRAAVGALDLSSLGSAAGGPTISIGVSCFPDDAAEVAALLESSDLALLEAKRAGRDRVVAYAPPASSQSAAS